MLDSVAPARRRLLLGSLAVAVAVVVVAGAAALLRPTAEPVDQAVPGPVVLVPGYGGGPDSVEPLRQVLVEAGRDAVVLDTPGDGTGDLVEQAEALAELVEDTVEEGESVDLVGYSAGGVVARLYVRDHGGDGVVRRVVTLGSPHHGTETAGLALGAAGSCPPACEQLAPDSDLLRGLNAGDETPDGPLWATLRTDLDETVVPVDSAVLEGAVNVLVQEVCPGSRTSHAGLPVDPVTAALLDSSLGVPAPVAPPAAGC